MRTAGAPSRGGGGGHADKLHTNLHLSRTYFFVFVVSLVQISVQILVVMSDVVHPLQANSSNQTEAVSFCDVAIHFSSSKTQMNGLVT
jgi:hypothetical protein